MARTDKNTEHFVRALLPRGTGLADGAGGFRIELAGRVVRLAADAVRKLQAEGVLAGDAHQCQPNGETRSWLRRRRAMADGFAAQHRQLVLDGEGRAVDVADNPLARLAGGEAGAFLSPHHITAGERFGRLFERAQLQPRMTMNYAGTRVSGRRSGSGDMSDMAADARKRLNDLLSRLPDDCVGVVTDVCGLGKGLQMVETERRWPRRSAKLVLRIGLEQLAREFGLAPHATGTPGRKLSVWLDEGALPTSSG